MSYADGGGLSLYYEVHGAGEPLVLLHGGLGSIEMFGPVLPALAEHRGGWDGSGRSNARLAILPGATHYVIFASPALAATVVPFLEAPLPGPA